MSPPLDHPNRGRRNHGNVPLYHGEKKPGTHTKNPEPHLLEYQKCGLGTEFIDAPDNFSVGKAGRNLSASDRQVVSLARMILAGDEPHPPILLRGGQKVSGNGQWGV